MYVYVYVYLHQSRIELLMTTRPFPPSALCRSPVLGPKLRLVARSLNIRRTKAWRGRHARISCGPCGGMNEPMVGRKVSWLVRSILEVYVFELVWGWEGEDWRMAFRIDDINWRTKGELHTMYTYRYIFTYTIWTADDSSWMTHYNNNTARPECHVAPGRSIREITITRPGREDLRPLSPVLPVWVANKSLPNANCCQRKTRFFSQDCIVNLHHIFCSTLTLSYHGQTTLYIDFATTLLLSSSAKLLHWKRTDIPNSSQ